VSPARLTVEAGGTPAGAEAAALAAALTALLDDERAAAAGGVDPLPPAYRSRWRRAAALEAVASMPHSKDTGPVWGGMA
jgi:hypothetical protein